MNEFIRHQRPVKFYTASAEEDPAADESVCEALEAIASCKPGGQPYEWRLPEGRVAREQCKALGNAAISARYCKEFAIVDLKVATSTKEDETVARREINRFVDNHHGFIFFAQEGVLDDHAVALQHDIIAEAKGSHYPSALIIAQAAVAATAATAETAAQAAA